MTSLTDRYLATTLRGIPERERLDVERELRSSISDAIEDRVAAGEPRDAAERATLDALGEPSRLAASYTGRPQYLVGPELFPVWRHVLVMLTSVVFPIVVLVLTGVSIAAGDGYVDALLTGFGGAISVGVQLAFWVTLAFVAIERFEVMREAREEIVGATGRWTVDMLPVEPESRIGLGETIGEVFTVLLTIGGLLFLRDTPWFTGPDGVDAPILAPALNDLWLPLLIGVLVSLAVLHVVIYLVGRWTTALAGGHAALQLAFAVPFVVLALTGGLVNPTFARELGWPPLAEGDGIVMLSVAAGVTLITAWEIVDGFRRARQARRASARAHNGWKGTLA